MAVVAPVAAGVVVAVVVVAAVVDVATPTVAVATATVAAAVATVTIVAVAVKQIRNNHMVISILLLRPEPVGNNHCKTTVIPNCFINN